VVKSEVLFPRLEDDLIEKLRDRYSGSQKERRDQEAGEEGPGGDEKRVGAAPAFAETLDLRTAKIVKVERHPKADKLYIETLEIAGSSGDPEERVIVSGLVPFYTEEQLLGKHIILAYNLKAAKLRGVESRGMLLAASDRGGPEGAERVELLEAGDIPAGTRVTLNGALPPASGLPEIDIDAFFKVPLRVSSYTVEAEGLPLTLAGQPITTQIIETGEVH
jgi:methionyl-tRNA synthetase